jgi:hypothetical protein
VDTSVADILAEGRRLDRLAAEGPNGDEWLAHRSVLDHTAAFRGLLVEMAEEHQLDRVASYLGGQLSREPMLSNKSWDQERLLFSSLLEAINRLIAESGDPIPPAAEFQPAWYRKRDTDLRTWAETHGRKP